MAPSTRREWLNLHVLAWGVYGGHIKQTLSTPGKINSWNLKHALGKRQNIDKLPIFRFHVSFLECIPGQSLWKDQPHGSVDEMNHSTKMMVVSKRTLFMVDSVSQGIPSIRRDSCVSYKQNLTGKSPSPKWSMGIYTLPSCKSYVNQIHLKLHWDTYWATNETIWTSSNSISVSNEQIHCCLGYTGYYIINHCKNPY